MKKTTNVQKNISKDTSKRSHQPVALHGTDGETHIVGLGNIKVIICQGNGKDAWFAQGLDIDYAANGHTLEEVKQNFQTGLRQTIDLHIKMHSNIEKFLKVAPQEVWDELSRVGGKPYHYSQVSFHKDLSATLGYQGISFIEPRQEVRQ